MTSSSLSTPILCASHRRQPPQRLGLVIGTFLAGMSLAQATLAAGVLPQGGHYVAGAGTITSQGDALTVTQPGSTRGVIDWNGFSIGKGNTVSFDNGSGATLNRVRGGSPSALFGSLYATGGMYLINPQGVLVGRSGVINTGGRFVASTLDLPDTAFMNGGTLTLAGFSNGKVVNLGKISSSGGDVFLISHDVVVNAGSVTAPNGTAEYVAGQQVVLYESSSSRQVFVQISSRGTVVDHGTTQAAQINLEAADGNIYALAGSGSRIRATGTTMRDGHIWLVAGNGRVTQQGTLEATNADGTGGTVDTLADLLTLGNAAAVHAGLWNISAPKFTIDSAVANAFMRSLNVGTSVDATATGTNGASGDMNVASNIDWQGPASLSLVAFHNVAIAPSTTIKNTGSGNLGLRADAASIDNTGSVANQGTIDWAGSTGIVSALYDMNGSYNPGTILANSAWTAPADSGLLTQSTAYRLVDSLADLQKIGQDLSGNFALGRDVDATPPAGTFNAPIGSFPSNPFTGQFDGMGHAIWNLKVNAPASSDDSTSLGLFSDIGTGAAVRNLSVQGNISGAATTGNYGILAGLLYGTIASVHTSGTVMLSAEGSPTIGGLVGQSIGSTITRSSSSADVSAVVGAIGGLVGANSGVIRQSFASGTVDGEGGGGLVSQNFGTILQSYATGAVGTNEGNAGGLVATNFGLIQQSFATGSLRSPADNAGIAVVNYGSETIIANDVFWDTQTTGATVAVLRLLSGAPMGNARGLTTAQMSTPSSFGPTYDFGPGGVWVLLTGARHPILRWQLSQ